nr:hypothetical protein [Tanacetum cinerariifolium]
MKKVNDVTRLQALVDKKRVIITEATIRDALRLADAKGIDCLPNEEIFTELARMRAQVGDFSSHSTKYSSPALTQKVFANMRRVGKGYFGVDTPLFEGAAKVHCNAVPAAVDESSIPLPIPPTQPPPPSKDVPSTSQGRIIAYMDADVDVTLKDVADIAKEVADDAKIEESADVLSMQDDKVEPAKLQEVVEVVTTAKLITEVVTAASTIVTPAAPQLTTVAAPILTTAPSAARRRKGVVIRDPEETATPTPSIIIHTKPKSKDKGKGILRKPQNKAQPRKNMMIYLKKMAGFKMDYFKGVTYDDIRLIFEKKFNSNVAFLQKAKEQIEEEEDTRALKRISKSQEDKAAKNQMFNPNLEESKKCSWYSKGQKLEAVRVLWCADYNIHYNTVDLAGREEISTYKVHSRTNAQKSLELMLLGTSRKICQGIKTDDERLNAARLN